MEAKQVHVDLCHKTGRYIVSLALKGSRNYELNDENSDYDYVGFFVPTMRELYDCKTQKHLTITVKGEIEGEQYEGVLFDIRRLVELTKHSNPCFLEYYYSKDKYDFYMPPRLRNFIENNKRALVNNNLTRFYYSTVGNIKEELAHLERNNTSLVEKYGYNTKKLSHAVRLAYLAQNYAEENFDNFDMCLRNDLNPGTKQVIKSIRNGCFTEDKGREFANDMISLTEAYYKEKYEEQVINPDICDRLNDEIYDTIFDDKKFQYMVSETYRKYRYGEEVFDYE